MLANNRKQNACCRVEKLASVKCFIDASLSKCFTNKGNIFIKAMIKKSYGNYSRLVLIKFEQNVPRKGHCNCPVGVSGLCCHVLALLVLLKRCHETGEKILELTSIEQIQKLQKRSNKGSIPMIPLKDIKIQLANLKKGDNMLLSAAKTQSQMPTIFLMPELLMVKLHPIVQKREVL